MPEAGIKNTKCLTVSETDTAASCGSGSLPVFATPRMAALMEATAAESVEGHLEPGTTTVGTKLNIDHLSADPVGVTVICESLLCAVDGRKLTFRITVRDSAGIVGEAEHERFIVRSESFMKKAEAKREGR